MKKILFTIAGAFVWCLAFTQVETTYINEQGLPFEGFYHYYNAQEQLVYTAEVDNGTLNGTITFFDLAGRIDQVGHYTSGQKTGRWEQYNDNGLLVGEAFYVNGAKHGIWSIWDDNGVKRYHMVYDMGQKVDVWKVFDEHQALVSEKTYPRK